MISATHLQCHGNSFSHWLTFNWVHKRIIQSFDKETFFKSGCFYLLIIGTFGTIAAYLSGDAAGEGRFPFESLFYKKKLNKIKHRR